MNEANIKTVEEIQAFLFHIHSMGMLLKCHHTELFDSKKLLFDHSSPSEPILTIADIIEEKAKICLNKLDAIEVHFRENERL